MIEGQRKRKRMKLREMEDPGERKR